ncbi:tail assembly protein [uncultured Aggregatibacter sp.]|uniref:tail assembly protein n=1 Tax=uncultured Aggregatibacter sp. TaxID=470564 RepID=UPI002591CCE8|nr:tail assembly protein [uncultured Aggregatibacter sp.]
MVTVKLYGSLKQFGSEFKLDVKDTAEIIRALCSQLPKFRETLAKGFYKVRIGKRYMDSRYVERDLGYQLKDGMTVHFTPVVAGAKKAGLFQTIVGAVLAVVGYFFGWTGIGAVVGNMGVALMLGGVAQMMTKTPTMPGQGKEAEKQKSTSFTNLSNMAAQGRPVPLAYGKIRTGSLIISQGVETYDVETAKTSEKPVGFRKGRM